jgi:hypothetical protein
MAFIRRRNTAIHSSVGEPPFQLPFAQWDFKERTFGLSILGRRGRIIPIVNVPCAQLFLERFFEQCAWNVPQTVVLKYKGPWDTYNPLSDADIKMNCCSDGAPHIHTHIASLSLGPDVEPFAKRHFGIT